MSARKDDGMLTNVSFGDGDIIFSQGERAHSCYLVRKGRVELVRQDADGFFETVEHVEPGHVFGKTALVSDSPYALGARAQGECACVQISRDGLDRVLQDADPFVRAMFRVLAGNLASIMELQEAAKLRAESNEDLSNLEVEGDDDEETVPETGHA